MSERRSYPRRINRSDSPIRSRNTVDLNGFFHILGRRFIWIVACVGGFACLAAYYIATAPLSYTSTVSILVDSRDHQPLGSDQQPLPQTADPILVESQLKLITTEAVLRRVVEMEHLESDPDYSPRERRPGLLDPVVRLIDRGRVPAAPMQQIVDRLAQDISVKRPDRTYVIEVDVKAPTPGKAARIADAVALAFISESRAATDRMIDQQTAWITSHAADLRTKLEAAEKRAQDYKAANGIVNAAGTLTNEQQLQDANRDLVAARAKTAEAQSRAEQIRRIIASGHALDGTYDTINSTVIRQLRVQYSDLARREAAASQKYGTRHPEYQDIQEQLQAVRTQITGEMQRVASALANEVQVAKGNEDAAQKRVASLESRTTATNETLLKLKELDRDVEANRVNYEKFARVSDGIRRDMTDAPSGRVLGPANVPSKPSSPKVLAAILVALFGGLGFGICLAVVIDYAADNSGAAPVTPDHPPGRDPDPAPGPHSTPGDAAPGRTGSALRRAWLSRLARIKGVSAILRRPLVAGREGAAPGYIGPTSAEPPPAVGDLGFAPVPPTSLSSTPADVSEPAEPVRGESAEDGAAAATPIDIAEFVRRFSADAAAGRQPRVLLTARDSSAVKTGLALTIARAAAIEGGVVLAIDANGAGAWLSRLAASEGLPAVITMDGKDLAVLGLPGAEAGVVFVLPHRDAAIGPTDADAPHLNCTIAAIVVDGPVVGADLAAASGLAEVCLRLETDGKLYRHPVAGLKPRDQAGPNSLAVA